MLLYSFIFRAVNPFRSIFLNPRLRICKALPHTQEPSARPTWACQLIICKTVVYAGMVFEFYCKN